MLHFGKIHTHTDHRSFAEGFLTAVGEMGNFASAPKVPGFHLDERKVRTGAVNPAAVAADIAALEAQCDIVETRPTFVVSNDDIYNLGHYYNDVMGVWGMLTLAGVSSKAAVLLNMDGLRPGGPAGKQAHRLMVPGSPDEHGPYIGYFNSWFAEVQKTSSFGAKRVCYKELYLPPMPGVAWFWNDWGIVNSCSMQAASPLYQSYNVFMRNHWRAAYGEAALPNPPTEVVHVVIEVRAIDPRKTNNHSKARHISNLAALVESLQALPGVKVTAQDFAKISFEKQVGVRIDVLLARVIVATGTGVKVTLLLRICAFCVVKPRCIAPFSLSDHYPCLLYWRFCGCRWRCHTPLACSSPCTVRARRTSFTPPWGSPTAAR